MEWSPLKGTPKKVPLFSETPNWLQLGTKTALLKKALVHIAAGALFNARGAACNAAGFYQSPFKNRACARTIGALAAPGIAEKHLSRLVRTPPAGRLHR